jgi:hypothetical protein
VACESIVGGATDLDASQSPLEILQRSDDAMRNLKSFRAITKVVPSVPGNPPYESAYDFRGAGCILPAGQVPNVQPNGSCPCGHEQLQQDYPTFFDRAKGGRPFGPPYAGGTEPANPRLEKLEAIDGRAAWVISYEFKTPSIEGPFTIKRREWVEVESFVLLRQEQTDDDPFGVRARVTASLSQFDALPTPPCR